MSLLRKAVARHAPRSLASSKRASVVLILHSTPCKVELLLIRRSLRDGDPWSGQMGLPGGHRHEQDSGSLQTALRETYEEIGVKLENCAELLGVLDDIQAAARGRAIDLVVTPYVYLVGAPPKVELGVEVAEVVWTPLSALFQGLHFTCHTVEFDGHDKVLPGWNVEGKLVWGLTYRIATGLMRLVLE